MRARAMKAMFSAEQYVATRDEYAIQRQKVRPTAHAYSACSFPPTPFAAHLRLFLPPTTTTAVMPCPGEGTTEKEFIYGEKQKEEEFIRRCAWSMRSRVV